MRAYTPFLVIGLVLLFFSPALSFAASGDEDSDGDGLYDYEDNCPYEPGPYKNNGCPEDPDYDGDGITDAQDNCPEVPNDDQTDSDYDGTGDACDYCDNNDDDGDGIPNCDDECPYEYGTSKNYGCPEQGELDTDKDGILDSVDNCVLIYNPDQGDQDGDEIGNACDDCDNRDSDKDGIDNCKDECPNEDGEPENDGCPTGQLPILTDSDGDGILDSVDECPKEYGTLKNNGCPVKPTSGTTPFIGLLRVDIIPHLDTSGGNRGRVVVLIAQPPPGTQVGLVQLFVDNIARGSCIMTRNCTVNVPELHPGSQLGASVLLTNFTMINIGIIPIGFILNNSQTQDTDRDGIANAFDNCVNVSNAGQEDDDHDNVGDACDSCNVRRARNNLAFFTIISCAGDPTVSFLRNGQYYWQTLYDRINTNTGCGCKDSDGVNYFFRGTTSTESVNTAPAAIDRVTGRAGYQATSSCAQADQDTCLDTNRLAETICTASGPSRTTITCPAGCSNGVCTCTDTDGGLNYLTRGTLLGNTDSCSGNSLTEYYCGIDSAGRMISLNRTIECPLGCDAGACLCSETDSGVQFERRGTVGNRYTDTCLDRRTLREYSVSRNATQCNLMNLTWTCEGSCQNGTCLPPTCYDAVQNQGETGVDCGGPCSACGYFMIHGNLKYEKGNPYTNITTLIGYRPIRETLVFALVQSDDDDIRSSYGGYGLLDSQGYFTIIVPRRAGTVYRLQIGASNMAANIGKDYHSCDEYVYFNAQRTFTVPAAGNMELGNMTIYKDREPDFNAYWTEEDSLFCGESGDINGGAQYFSIADTLLIAKQYVDANRDDTDALGRVNIAYPETVSSSGAAMHSSGEISIPGPNSFYHDSDPGYRDKTVLHEYGHNIEYRISTSDLYIGDSDHSFCSQNDEEFAWSEGFAEYFAQFIMNKYRFDPIRNLSMVGENGYGIENPTCSGGLNSMIEGAVQAVLWDLADVVGPTYPAANITEASFDRVANKDRVIMRIVDKELDDCCDAPDICDFVRGTYGWKNRASEVGTTSDIDSILIQYGMNGVTGSSGGC